MRSVVATRLRMAAVAALASLMGGIGLTAAQEMPGGMEPGMMNRGMMERQEMMCSRMDQHIDGDLAYLKTELKITESQMQQWNAFAQAFRAERERKARLCKEALDQAREMRSASLIDAMKMAEDQLSQRLDSLRAMKAAVQPLYASLDKEQKKTADQIMRGGQIF